MQKFCRIAVAITLSLSSFALVASENVKAVQPDALPVLSPEDQHSTASKRISAKFTRSHYKAIEMDDILSEEVFYRYLEHLDYAKNIFLLEDINQFKKHQYSFDNAIKRGQLDVAYDIYNINMQRRLERYQYAISLLDKPFDFTKKESYNFDREFADWPKSVAELNELWRLKVKYDALNLTLAGKEWQKVQEVLGKRYRYAIKRLKQTESEDVFQIVMNSFARVVEPHTSYLSPRNAEKFKMEMNLSLEGIGAVLRGEDDYTVVQSLVSGGPADKTNEIKPKDRIVGVSQDDEEFVDIIGWRLDDVVEIIKGPKGTKVRLQIMRGDTEDPTNLKVVSIIRDTIKLEDRAASSKVYPETPNDENAKNIGVITIPSFYNHLTRDVKKEIAKLKQQNIEGLIIDLRSNGGGSLPEAIELTGLFIDKGPVVQVRENNNRVDVKSDRDGKTYYDGPLTVMVDRNSASASEIFSAAIQDYGRGIIIGEHTFGKGTVQQHIPLGRPYDLFKNRLGSIQYTIAKFYRIDGGSTQHRGVLPDISFPSMIDPADWGESKEKNALPWDKIKKAEYGIIDDRSDDIAYLTARHKERIKQNREFNYLLDDIVRYKKEKDDTTISLNLAERTAKKEERKVRQLARVNQRLADMGAEPVKELDNIPEDVDKQLDELDPFLEETAKITFDLIAKDKLAKQ